MMFAYFVIILRDTKRVPSFGKNNKRNDDKNELKKPSKNTRIHSYLYNYFLVVYRCFRRMMREMGSFLWTVLEQRDLIASCSGLGYIKYVLFMLGVRTRTNFTSIKSLRAFIKYYRVRYNLYCSKTHLMYIWSARSASWVCLS